MLESKPWYQSRTIMLNVAAALLVAIQALTGALQPLLPVDIYQTIATGLPVANAFLRLLTETPVTIN